MATEAPLYPLSHSSIKTKRSCPRKYYLYKVANHPSLTARSATIHTAFGSAVGTGVAQLLTDPDDLPLAYHLAFSDWDVPIYTRDRGKFIHAVFSALEDFQTKARELRDAGFVIATINSRPASELSFKLTIPNMGYYVGFIDIVLHNERTGNFICVECKTTNREMHPALFSNSQQDVSYLAIATAMGSFSADSLYPILTAKVDGAHWKYSTFKRTKEDFDNFFKSLLLEYQHLQLMHSYNHYPKNGDACMSFSQLCPLYGECDKSFPILPPKPKLDDKGKVVEETWDLEVTLEV